MYLIEDKTILRIVDLQVDHWIFEEVKSFKYLENRTENEAQCSNVYKREDASGV